jgi:hypothetical protein
MIDDMVDMVMSIETMTVKYNTLKKMPFVNDWLVTRFSTLGKKHHQMYILFDDRRSFKQNNLHGN